MDISLCAEPVTPAREQQPDPEIEILGEAVAPRPRAERPKRRKADELAVAAQPHVVDMGPTTLEDVGIDHELHVLHAGQQVAMPVVDADTRLHTCRTRVAEVRGDGIDGMGIEAPVRVDDNDDHIVRVPDGDLIVIGEVGDGGVQRRALA